MTETLSGGNIASSAMARSCSPCDMLLPPIQTAVLCRSLGPRVKMQPWIRSRTSSGTTSAVAHDLVGAGIVRHDLVEHAGKAGGIELQQQLPHRIEDSGE